MRWWNGFALFATGLVAVLMVMSLATHSVPQGLNFLVAEAYDPSTSPPFATVPNPSRTVVIQVGPMDVKINADSVSRAALPGLMAEIMKTREEKFAFVWADRDVDFQRFAEIVGELQTAVPTMYTVLITDKDRNSSENLRVRIPRDPSQRYLLIPVYRVYSTKYSHRSE